MRAILIDPENKTVTEIQISSTGTDDTAVDNRIDEIKTLLQCESFTSGAHLRGSISKGFDDVMVSDDELDEQDYPRFWFQVDADRDPPSSFPIAGRGLALGCDKEGETCDVQISVEELAKRITFTKRKFRGFDVQHNVGGFDIAVSTVAPIIEEE